MNRQPIVYSLVGLLAGGAITALILLTAKSTSPIPASNITPSAQTATPLNSTTPFRTGMRGQTDQRFIVMMIPHHEDAVAMADLALIRAKHPELKTLARSIKTTQTREIQDMQTWFKQWYGAEIPKGQLGIGMGRWGMMNMRTNFAELQNARDFDRTFIEEMIPHHQMAVMMAQMVLTNSQHPETRNLAESIIKSQTAEINQMQQWYQAWYPSHLGVESQP